MNERALWQQVAPEWREPLIRFLVTGRASPQLEDYFNHSDAAQRIADLLLDAQRQPYQSLIEDLLAEQSR
jgi:hypothetical protein